MVAVRTLFGITDPDMRARLNWQAASFEFKIPTPHHNAMRVVLDEIELHHAPTARHSIRVGITAAYLAEVVGLPAQPVFLGGSGHDCGKTKVSAELLDKKTLWTPSDAAALANHPADSYNRLIQINDMEIPAIIADKHHGGGEHPWPDNKNLDSREAMAKIVTIADQYDARHRGDRKEPNGLEIHDNLMDRHADKELRGWIERAYDLGIFSIQHATDGSRV